MAMAALLPFVLISLVSASDFGDSYFPRSHHHSHHPPRKIEARALPGQWTQVGCFSDSVAQRSLSAAGYTSGTAMTNEACVNFCNDRGYARAGTEYSAECFCGNSLLASSTALPMSSCNMPCSGNAGEVCGGGNALLVFSSGAANPPPAPGGPTELPEYGLWDSLGCYTDTVAARTLLTQVGVAGGPMTPQRCMDACQSAATPFHFAGVEYAAQCFCGHVISNGGVPAASGCNMACEGDASLLCGGPNRLNLYNYTGTVQAPPAGPTVVPTYGLWKSQGCWTDSVAQRTLKIGLGVPGTVPACLDACHNAGYTFGGVEYGGECFCDNQTAATGAPATDGCTMPCSGASSTLCGGPNRLNLYKYSTSAYGLWDDLGCWTDSVAQRTLTTGAGIPGTIPACLDACYNAGKQFGGVEYGGECWCGSQIAATGAPATDGCTMPCSGDASTTCGGPNRLNMFNYTGTITQNPTDPEDPPPDPGNGNAPPVLTTGLPAPWHYAKCWVDNAHGRILINQGLPPSPTMTVQTCVNYCNSQGFVLAGLQYSQECWCGNSVNNAGTIATSEAQCNMACSGDAGHACGGPNRFTMYSKVDQITVVPVPVIKKTGLPGSFQYAGCYAEPGAARVFPYMVHFPTTNSIETCLSRCSEYGYAAAGLEYGEECWCGDFDQVAQNGGVIAPDADCTMPCTGTPEFICGGVQRLSLYTWTSPPLYVWNQPAVKGHYEFLIGSLVIPLIAVVGINDKVVFLEKYGTGPPNSTGAYELDPSLANDFSRAWKTMHVESDVFCAANLVLPDKSGRILSVGGWSFESTEGVRLYTPDGSPGVSGTNDWEENYSELHLQQGRWYPTAMIMANGSILVVGGESGANAGPVPTLEILPTPAGGPTWLYMDWLERTDPNNLYPFLAVLPHGGIFVQYYNEARILNEVTFATDKALPNLPGNVVGGGGRTYPLEGTTVILPQHAPYTDPIEFMSCGGSNFGAALDNCVSIQPEGAAPTWIVERMPSKRVMSLMVALPDGTFFIAGGAHQGVAGFGLANDPNYSAVLYDPSKPRHQRFSVLASTPVARMYHSEAVLLSDGRIMISGSDPQDNVNPQEYRIEVYLPPYLVDGRVQPQILALPVTDWVYGQVYTTTLQLSQTGPIRFSLLSAVASTHGSSMGIRTIFPEFSCVGNTCTIKAPPDAHVCPPGWFQLFALDGPTPSHAKWVRIGGDPAKLGQWPPFADFAKPGL